MLSFEQEQHRQQQKPTPFSVLRGHSVSQTLLWWTQPRGLLLTGSPDGTVHVWDFQRRRKVASFPAHKTGVLRVDELGGKIVSQGRDGLVKLWDMERVLASGADPQQPPQTPLMTIRTGAFHFCQMATVRWKAQNSAATCMGEEGVGVGDAKSQSEENGRAREEEENGSSGSLAEHMLLLPDEHHSRLRLVDVRESGENPVSPLLLPPHEAKQGMVMCCRLLGASPVGRGGSNSLLAVAGYEDGSVVVHDMRSTRRPLIHQRIHKEPTLCLDVDRKTRKGVSGCAGRDVQAFKLDMQKGKLDVVKAFPLSESRPGCACVEIRPDQRLFAVGGWDHRVRLFDLQQLKPLAVLKHHEESIYAIAFAGVGAGGMSPPAGVPHEGAKQPQGLFSVASKDCRVSLWDIY